MDFNVVKRIVEEEQRWQEARKPNAAMPPDIAASAALRYPHQFWRSESRSDWTAFLPFDALAGVKLTDNLEISLEVGVPIVKEYPV
jgi:hypothetical protein